MATPNISAAELAELEKKIKRIEELSGKFKANINTLNLQPLEENAGAIEAIWESLEDRLEQAGKKTDYLVGSFKDLVDEIKNSKSGLADSTKSLKSLSNISEQLVNHQRGYNELSSKELSKLQDKVKIERERLVSSSQRLKDEADELTLQKNSNNFTRMGVKEQQKILDKLDQTKAAQESINNLLSVQDVTLADLNTGLNEELKSTKELEKRLGIVGGVLKGISKIPIIGDLVDTERALKAMKEAGGGIAGLKAGIKDMGSQFMESITNPANIALLVITQIVEAFKSVDSAIGDLAKGFDMSYNSAANLRMELTDIANFSMDVAVTTKGLQESMMAIGQTLGSNARLNSADLVTFTKLREQAGYTNDELAGIQKLTLATGGSLEDNTASFLGSVAALNGQNKLTINAKQLLKEVANVSDSIKLSIGGTTEKLAEAAFKAKQFGINLQQADQISQSLLDFESSIADELSAELITGKDLNLEKARLLAINGDIAGASEEILKQVGGTAEFTKMNRIQQEALAKATGLSRDDLAASLMSKEALVKLSGVEGKDAKEKYDNLVKQVGVEEAKKRLGNEALANQFQQQSVQERFAQSIEKLKELFVSLVEPLMPVFDVFADIMGVVGPIVGVLGTIIKYTMQWGKYLLYAVGIYKTLKFLGDSTYRNTILTNIAKKTGVITDQQANFQAIRRNMLTNENIMSENTMATIKKRSLGTVILTNIQEKIGLATKEGGLLLTIKDSAIKFKDFVLEKGKNALLFTGNILKAIGNTLGIVGVGIQKAGNISAGKGLLSKAGEFIMGMFSAGAKAPFPLNLALPFILGGIAGGIAATVIGKFMKGDDVVSPGYGKRTLMSPEGAITLNDKDTVIAGTNLGGKGNSKGNSQQSAYMDPALLNEIRAMRQEQARSNNKPTVVENSMNGTKFGTALHMNTYKVQ